MNTRPDPDKQPAAHEATVAILTPAQLRAEVRAAIDDALAEHAASAAPDARRLLTREQLAHALGCSMPMLDKLRRQGMPGEVRLGDAPRWPTEALDTIIEWLRGRG